ncbi:MAG: glucosyltransferase [Lachnospiraceae bacterium]|nr:glucosyltransferase [Lachnospiraceae bacterium]
MKIAWFCVPAHGHTNPTLGLVKALTDAGHEIYYFSFNDFKEKLENAGAKFVSCDGYDFDMEDKENGDRVGKDMAFAVELLVCSTLSLDEMIAKNIEEIKPDLIITDSIAYWGKLTAKKFNIPFISSTTTFAFNRYSSAYMKRGIMETLKMLFSMPKINKQLDRLREKGYPIKNILDIVQNDNETNTIVYTSKFFQPCADTFSDKYKFIGPSMRAVENEVKKTKDTTVYISLGTVVKNENFYSNCIEAFKKTDYQVIIALGTNDVSFGELPENIKVYKSVDQMAVLSIADVFITHCGMNSTSEALYYEVPLVMCPQTPEQGAVARRTEELGAGVMLNDKSTPEDILNIVNGVIKDTRYKEAAKKVSESFKNSGGIEEAKEFVENILK